MIFGHAIGVVLPNRRRQAGVRGGYGLVIMTIVRSCKRARSINPARRKTKCAGGSKKYRCSPRLAVHLYLIGPICQFASSTRRREERGGEGTPDRGPAPTRFSGAHAAPDIAGIMERRGGLRGAKGRAPAGEAGETCGRIFTENPTRPRASFSDVLEKYDRHSTASSSMIYARRCAAYAPPRWIGLCRTSGKARYARARDQPRIRPEFSVGRAGRGFRDPPPPVRGGAAGRETRCGKTELCCKINQRANAIHGGLIPSDARLAVRVLIKQNV